MQKVLTWSIRRCKNCASTDIQGAKKVYALDVGLLATMSGLAPEVVLDGPRIFREFRGALTEQYVCQQLVAETGLAPCYWSTDDSRTEIDFVFQRGMPDPVTRRSGVALPRYAEAVRELPRSLSPCRLRLRRSGQNCAVDAQTAHLKLNNQNRWAFSVDKRNRCRV
ncbi:MAG: DUF4143 domain-containing protein [Kiritimatiellae bacterium]|nr:DUF4143 domain-containing protein [Kiritimatiellia bacterium]